VAFRAFVLGAPAGRVLDVGCGPGHYLRVWKELGWEIEGLEPNELVAARAGQELGALVRRGFAETAELPHAAYDLVTMSHSLEHLRSPRTALSHLRRALKPDGRLLLMVPNFAAWERRAFRQRWQGLEAPRHLYHFEPTTITALLRSTGYSVMQIGGTAHASTFLRSLRDWARMGSAAIDPGRVERAVATALLLPLAAVRRSTSLWIVARCA
jgi:SAM-dependent methyltransferase